MKKKVLHPVRFCLHKKKTFTQQAWYFIVLSLLFLLLPITDVQAQVSLDLDPGLKLEMEGALVLELEGDWINNGSFLAGDGTVIFNGTEIQTITNAAGETFNKLFVNKSSGVVQLNNNITIIGELALNSGDLDLNGQTIFLEDGAVLIETPGNTIIGESGYIVATQILGAPSSVDVGGLGFVLTSTENLGSTDVNVGHDAQSANGHQGILRYCDVTPTNNSGLDATIVLHYDDSELNGNTESLLELYRSTDGGVTWTAEGGTVDTENNTITLSGVDALSRWTVSSQPLVQQPYVTVELRDSNDELLQNSGAAILYQPKSSGAYINFGDGVLDANGIEIADIAEGTHRFRLSYQGATQTIQQNVTAGSVVTFQTTLTVVELRDSNNNLIQNSGATITWQSGSSGSYVNFGDGNLDGDGTEKLEVLPLTHSFRLSYPGATQTKQQNVSSDSVVVFQTVLAIVELRDSGGDLIENSEAIIKWQPGSSGRYVDFGDGTLDADGSEEVEVMGLTHRFRLTYQGKTLTKQQNVDVDPVVVFTSANGTLSKRSFSKDLSIYEGEGVPGFFAFHANYPNPFNPKTTIRFDLPEEVNVKLEIYNMFGQKVRTLFNSTIQAGYYNAQWDATNDYGQVVVSGVYICRIHAGSFVDAKRLIFVK
ncbi:T9SS type A sorting domain-containing protein [candidate division KSB1 bacterium]|nr:T9SS type A sorting domain-containing protein [candidate division KSB1 bacterium]